MILYFYPAAMTPGCTTEACDFSAAKPDLDTAGYTVLGVSPDQPDQAGRVHREERSGRRAAQRSGPQHVLTAYGAYGEKQNYGRRCWG